MKLAGGLHRGTNISVLGTEDTVMNKTAKILRAGSGAAGGGGVLFPRLLYCFPDLSPRRRPAEEGGEAEGGRGRRRAS